MSYELQPIRRFRTPYHVRKKMRLRQHALRDEGLCLNGRGHGKATHGLRCSHCATVQIGRHLQLPAQRAHLTALRLVRELREIARV